MPLRLRYELRLKTSLTKKADMLQKFQKQISTLTVAIIISFIYYLYLYEW